jgi:hypothetical protein
MGGRSNNTTLLFFAVLMYQATLLHAQVAGKQSFQFLNTPINAKLAGLGGYNVSLHEGDPNWIVYNPAMLDSATANDISLNYVNFYGGSKYSQLVYVANVPTIQKVGFGLTHLSHGNFESYDEAGNYLGTFDASEYAFRLSVSHKAGPFVFGVSPIVAVSSIAGFRASALMIDIGGVFQHPEKAFSAGLVMKNTGFPLGRYAGEKVSLPFDVQLGATFKPEQMPVRFSLTASNLPKQNLVYFDPGSRVYFNHQEPGYFDKIFTRANMGAEFLLGPNFHLLAGYNHRIRNELRLEQTAGGAGFSFGAWIKIKSFELAISRAHYHVLGGNTHFTVSHNVDRLFNKRKKIS